MRPDDRFFFSKTRKGHYFYYAHALFQTQSNGIDFGPYALAFASDLVMGENPGKIEFCPLRIRQSAIDCLVLGKLSNFPAKPIKRPTKSFSFEITVFCSCRLTARLSNPAVNSRPFREEQMVCCLSKSCIRWYHRVCLESDAVFNQPKNFVWLCPLCM